MIPDEKSDAVFRGLREVFGTEVLEDIQKTTRGLSSDLVFRIVVQGTPYLLRIMTRIDERLDPGRIFACMNAAAEAGITPRVRYSYADDGISITDFVEAVPFPATQALVELPRTLRRLHALPPFPKAFNYVTAHNGFVWRFRKMDVLRADEVEEVFNRYEQVCAVYPRIDSDIVSCHSDLKPDNILFDGKRVWLVDWQAAFLNDRYFDLAVAANFLATGEADERTYLEQYFDRPPDDLESARFFLMQQVVHMLSATVFLLLGSAGKPIILSEKLPLFEDFHRRIRTGDVNLADNDLKIVYGMVHWDRLARNVRQTKFSDALQIVSKWNSGREDVRPLLPSAPK